MDTKCLIYAERLLVIDKWGFSYRFFILTYSKCKHLETQWADLYFYLAPKVSPLLLSIDEKVPNTL
jgi:hypothetical protein